MGIDFTKLASFVILTFMLIEVVKVLIKNMKTNVIRIVSLILVAGFSAVLAALAPVFEKNWLNNFIIYLITEYFVFLVIKNEMKISIKNIILKKLGIHKEK